MTRPLVLVHSNPARLADGRYYVDRKFHTGMQEYGKRFDLPIVAVNPLLPPENDGKVMDLVAVPENELGYRPETVAVAGGRPVPEALSRLEQTIAGAALVYGSEFGVRTFARKHGVP